MQEYDLKICGITKSNWICFDMKLVVISDTHNMHDHKNIPDGDVLIHAGDITGRGQLSMLEDFMVWMDFLPHKHKIVIAGNHDFCFQNNNDIKARWLVNKYATYLEDSSVVIDGIKFYGAPWQPEFNNWAFNLPRGEALREKWALIEDDTNVLITHGPPQGILDWCPGGSVGCTELLQRTTELKHLKYHFFGHIHEGYGVEKHGDLTYANASICNRSYKPFNEPLEFEI